MKNSGAVANELDQVNEIGLRKLVDHVSERDHVTS